MKKIIKTLFLVVIILAIPGILFNKYVKASSSNVNVTVPANINAVFNSDGTNTISNYKIMNDSLVPIKVVNVTSSQTNGWELISDTSVLTKDTKKLKLMLDGKVIMNGANAMDIDINDGAEYSLPIKIDRGAWTTTVKESAFNLTFNYEIGKKEFNLSFNSNGGTPINTQKVFNGDVITLPTSVKRGYTQTGWVDANGVTYAPGTKFTMPIGDVNLTATWTINNYELSVKAKVGTSLYDDLSPYGTFDVYVNGKRTDDYITSYSKYLPYNTAYDIRDIKTKPGIKYEGKSVLSMGGTIPDSNVSVELPFSVNTYSIGYNLDGGSITGNPISYKTSSGNLNITNPVKVGYTFNGWTESISPKDWYNGFIDYPIGDAIYNPGYPNAVFSEQIDIHPGTYTLDVEGLAKDQVRIRQYRKDGSYVGNIVGNSYATFNIEEEGYVRVLLLDNNDTAKSTVKLTREVDKATIPTGSAGNRHYAAKWKANTYTVVYHGNAENSSGSTATSTHTYDVPQALTANGFKFPGHSFSGWNTSSYDIGTSYSNKQSVKNLTTKPGDTIHLFAQWEPNKYTMTINPNNGEPTKTVQGVTGDYVNLGKPVRPGFNFASWKPSSSVVGKQGIYANFSNGTEQGLQVYRFGMTDSELYGNLEVIPASSDNPTNSDYEVKINATKPYLINDSYTYVGFRTKATTADSNSYYHTFKAKLPKGVKLGIGWNNIGTGGTKPIWITSNCGTGEWETYAYKAYVGTNATHPVIGYVYVSSIDSSVSVPFSWNLAETMVVDVTEGNKDGIIGVIGTENTTVTAQWNPISYNVKYDANGGTGTTATSTHSYNSTSTLTPNGFTREYHKFIGWNTKPDGSGTSYTDRQSISNLTTVDGSTVTLYAQWEGNTITLKYHANGGTRHNYSTGAVLATPSPIQTETQRYDFENPYKTGLASFANDGSLYMRREGYTHPNISKEWLVNSPTSGITQHGEEPVKYIDIVKKAGKLEQLKTGNVTVDLYANWILKDYTITSNLDGGTVSPTIPTSYTLNSEAIKLANPTKTGHSFNGWIERIKPSVWYKGDLNREGDIVASTRGAYYSDKLFVKAGQTYKWNSDRMTSGARFYPKDGSAPVFITDEQTGFTPSQDGYIRLLNVYHDTNLDRAKTLYLETITPVKDLTISKGSTGNREYIAKWTPNSYYIDVNGVVDDTYVNVALPITYDVYINGSLVSKGVNDFYKSYPYGSTYEIKNVVAHTGYTYNGITSDSAPLKGTVSAGGTKIKFSITTNSYKSQVGHVALGFNGEVGTNTEYPSELPLHNTILTNKYNTEFTLNQYLKIPNGYRFDQYGMRDVNDKWLWYTDVNHTFTQIPKVAYGGIYYKPVDYKITYNLNGGTNHSSNPSTYNVLYGVTLKEPTRIGYTFDGWYIDGVKVTGINPGATASFSSTEDFYDKVSKRATGNKTVEARWTLNKYALDVNAYIDGVAVGTTLPVKFDMYLNGSLWKAGISDFCYEQNHGTKYEVKNIVPNPGYSCSGVATGSLPLSGTVTKASYVVLNITTNNYTIGYNLNGGSVTGNPINYKVTSENITLPKPVRTGFTFSGWTEEVHPTSWTKGFISLEDGSIGLGSTGDGYPNAKYSDYIRVEKGKTYSTSIDNSGTTIRIRAYDNDLNYIGSFNNGTGPATYTPKEDGYVRLLVLDSTVTDTSKTYLKNNALQSSWIIPKGSTGNKTYTANWKENALTVNYYSNYGDSYVGTPLNPVGADKNVIVKTIKYLATDVQTDGLLNVATNGSIPLSRTGYSSTAKWGTTTTGGKLVHQDTGFKTSMDMAKALGTSIDSASATVNVYPQWSENVLTVNYYSNYATKAFEGALNPVGVDKNVLVRVVKYPATNNVPNGLHDYTAELAERIMKRDGYTGTGNYGTATTGGKLVHQDTVFANGMALAKALGTSIDKTSTSINVYPQWTINRGNLYYYPNGGVIGGNYGAGHSLITSGEFAGAYDTPHAFNYTDTTGNTVADIISYFEKTGYHSAPSAQAWRLGSPTSTTYIADNNQDLSGFVKDKTNVNLKLYANWEPNVYTVKYDANGGSGTTASSAHTYDSARNLVSNEFTRTGYTFTGWNTKPDGSGTSYANGASVKNLTSTNKGTVTLYAQWKANTYTYNVTYKSSTGKALGTSTVAGTYGSSKSVSAPAKTGYTTPSAQTVKFDSTSAKTITFTYPIVNYTISYNLGGGTVSGNPTSYNVESSTITLKNPAKTGFTFKGWTGSNGSSVQTSVSIASGSTGNKSYTANWTANNYTLTFNANGGSVSTASKVVANGAQYGTLPTPTRTGYTFAGWYTAASGGTKVSTTTVMGASNVTVYAHWTANTNTKVTVRHNTMNYDGHTYTLTETVSTTGTSDTTITLSNYKKTYSGLTYANGKVGGTTVTTTTVSADGSRVIDLYYSRQEAILVTGSSFKSAMTTVGPNATSIVFQKEPITSNKVSTAKLISDTSSAKKAYMYLDGTKIVVAPESTGVMISANANCSNMFYNRTLLTSIVFDNFNTSRTTNMFQMFSSLSKLTTLDLTSFNTSNVTSMASMVSGCSGLTSIDVSSFNVSNTTNLAGMFMNCGNITSLNLSNFATGNTLYFKDMFNGMTKLTTLNITNFNTGKATTFQSMFAGCSSLRSIALTKFRTTNVTNMANMFKGCTSLVGANLTYFNTSKVTTMSGMFDGCTALKTITAATLDTGSLVDTSYMFRDAINVSVTMTIHSNSITKYTDMFKNAATSSTASIVLNPATADIKPLVQNMVNTKSSNSHVSVKQ